MPLAFDFFNLVLGIHGHNLLRRTKYATQSQDACSRTWSDQFRRRDMTGVCDRIRLAREDSSFMTGSELIVDE